ncbi:MAG: hypothetical protein FJ387_09280 [Verrucomicrobia bacterium]|nr:hypothetical protein [Verrucomicrobiota bacterium]
MSTLPHTLALARLLRRTVGRSCWIASLGGLALAAPSPIELHPDNPHYFRFRGQPTVLITSGEHYGAVLNLDFDYRKYLETLAADGLNLTRTFTGAYVEPAGAFNITRNTLAPAPGRFISPWARSDQPGYANGGNKFDLARWDPAYFARLKDFLVAASRAGVVVELNLFCPFYEDSQWRLSPMNAANNVNAVGAVARTNVYTLDRHGGLLPIQEALVRQLVTELKDFDNLYYELCNEPYFGGVTRAWQHRIADVIAATEQALGVRHLISQNVANGSARIAEPHPALSIFNFHYATPPDAVALNYGLNKVIGDNETGFNSTNDAPYRIEGWDFLMAGGGLFNHLDYSFAVGHEDGSFLYPSSQPGGGNPVLRRQLGFLKQFLLRFDLLALQPAPALIVAVAPTPYTARALAQRDDAWAIYVAHPPKGRKWNQGPLPTETARLELDLPPGSYSPEWLNPRTGASELGDTVRHRSGRLNLTSPPFVEDIALRLVREP